jgi:2-dehydro-3-deoxyglucarate aldolase/4-hydroxy-2-oxoheptanedioate aldolase
MTGQLKRLLEEGRPVRLLALGQLCHPKLVELAGFVGGLDAVWLDQEHAGLTIAQIEEAARAARAAGLDSFVRLTATDYATVMRPLEAGAGGLMAAMVREAREAQDVVRWARFHPQGMRGVNGSGVDGQFGLVSGHDYFRRCNDRIVVGIQIEHADAVEEVEAIAAVPGVDFLFIGPSDLSQTLGIPCEWEHPRLWAAIERVAAACRSAGRPWGILPLGPAHARRCVALGCGMLSIALDVWLFRDALRTTVEAYREVFSGS